MSVSGYECRLCLKDSQFCYSLFDENVIEIIESFTAIKIEEDDNLPATCCSQCLEDVYFVCRIRSRIIESDKILHDRFVHKEHSDVIEIDEEPEQVLIKSEVTPEDSNTVEIREAVCVETQVEQEILPEIDSLKRSEVFCTCKICGRQLLRCNYKKHLDVHCSSPKVCELCGAVAKNAESLRGHMFYMHKSTAEQYKCNECGKYYRYKYKFELHMRKAHGGDKTHICEFCGKGFYTARDVKRHIQMTHMKLRPYICQYCNKGFSSSHARRTHIRQHTNEKPYKCEICAEGFRQRVSLRTHLKSKHGVLENIKNNVSQQTALKVDDI